LAGLRPTSFSGTTPSGRASQTTLGNCLNSTFLAQFYIHKALKILDPWNKRHKDTYKLSVCGDDIIIQFKEEIDAIRVRDYIEEINCPKGVPTVRGLG